MICEALNKVSYFNQLLSSVSYCNICKRMCMRRKVLSEMNGNLNAKVMFIAEAPGRLGAECTGIPLYGDKTGENFDVLLSNISWKRDEIFITNAVLCNPQNEEGNNSTPSKEEILNCNYYLKMQINIINPDVIVTLGATALDSLRIIHNHNYTLKNHVAEQISWNGRIIYPLYHMGPMALMHRSLIKQRGDFIKLSNAIHPIKGFKQKVKREDTYRTDDSLLEMAKMIVSQLGSVSLFKLTKLLYLIDYKHYVDYGHTISGTVYLRLQEGPWIPSLLAVLNQHQEYFASSFIKRKPYISSNVCNTLDYHISSEQYSFIHNIIERYKDFSDSEIKTTAYLTEPMKYILIQEMKGRDMSKKPVLYKSSTICDEKVDVTPMNLL